MKFFRLFSLLLCVSAKSQVALNSSLVACYALNGNANDPISGLNGNLGTVIPTADRFGNPGAAYYFNGSTISYIELPNSALIKCNALSVSCWVKLDGTSSSNELIFAHNGCTVYHEGYQLSYENYGPGMMGFQVVKADNSCSYGGQIRLLANMVPVLANTWYHVGFYAGPDSLKLYINGSLATSMVNNNALVYSSTANVYLGGTNLNFNFPLSGAMDNVRFYNRKLSNAEMQALYTQDPVCVSTPPPVSLFSLPASTVCAGGVITCTDLSSNSPTSWQWSLSGPAPATSTLQNPFFNFPSAGTYTLSLQSANAAGAGNTATATIVALPSPVLSTQATSTLLCVPSSNTSTLTATGGSSYTWSTGQTGSLVAVVFSYSASAQNQTVTVTGTGTNGCTSSAAILVHVTICEGLPGQEKALTTIAIQPNPANEFFELRSQGFESAIIRITDVMGRNIWQGKVESAVQMIDASHFPAGVYFVRVSDNKRSGCVRLLKQ